MKVKLTEGVRPITEFRREAARLVARICRTRQPIAVTRNGRVAVVVEDARTFEEQQERLEFLESIVRGLDAAERGKVVSHARVMEEARRALGE